MISLPRVPAVVVFPGAPRRCAAALLCLGALLAGGGCSFPDDTAALVDGHPVPMAELDRAFDALSGENGELPPAGPEAARLRADLLRRLVDRELMYRDALARALAPSPKEIEKAMALPAGEDESTAILEEASLTHEEWRLRVTYDLAIEKAQQAVMDGAGDPPEEEIAAEMRKVQVDTQVPETVRALHILVRTREEALRGRERILDGEPFESVAREISLSPDAAAGGDLGYFSRRQMPEEFDAVVFSLPVGKVSEVTETSYGHHLFLVTDRQPARSLTDAEVREKIIRRLRAVRREKAFRAWLNNLRGRAEIRYNPAIIPE